MFKTDRDNNLDSRYNLNKEPVTSRYMNLSKKKYYLASAEHNLEQLKEEQIKTLTALLIELKGEYDELTRETSMKKKETEQLGKQIEMLDKMDKKVKNRIGEMEENYNNTGSLIEIKKVRKEEEAYTRLTLVNLIEKMKDEMLIIQKDIHTCENETRLLNKKFEKERIVQNTINEKINQVYSKIQNKKMKNVHERNEGNLVLQYYHNIIDQKWSFIYSADERKNKQAKIAQEAKNDSQDKQEVEKRKLLFLCSLYDKYLRTKMERELKDNENLEETFQTIRDITGSSNLKSMVDKILNKDKNYNLCVSKVAEKQSKIAALKKDIITLEEKVVELKNEVPDNQPTSFDDSEETTKESINPVLIEESEMNLLKEESEIMDELKGLQEKHQNVILVYEKVMDNLKSICIIDKSKEDTINVTHSQILNLNESKVNDSSAVNLISNNQSANLNEEDIYKGYSEFLENIKKSMDNLFLNHSVEDFMAMMKEKGIEPVSAKARTSIKKQTFARKMTNATTAFSMDRISKELAPKQNNLGNEEYEYSDEELKKEDEDIKMENDEIMKRFKAIERNKLLEAMKSEKDKK